MSNITEIIVLSKMELSELLKQNAIAVIEELRKQETKADGEVMTTKETALYLKVSEQTVRNRIRDENLPVSNKVGDPRFIRSDIDAWLRGEL